MCGRYSADLDAEQLIEAFAVIREALPPDLKPRYNVAPTQAMPIVRLTEGRRAVHLARWGLVPGRMKEIKGPPHINAMSETVAEKPLFRTAFRRSRCLVPATGFYEWRKTPSGKQAMHFHLPGRTLFAFAGLREYRKAEDGTALESFTILTTEANALVADVHGRMPVILPREAHDAWLDPEADPAVLARWLGPYPAEAMVATPVGDRVNKVANDDPACMEPFQTTLF